MTPFKRFFILLITLFATLFAIPLGTLSAAESVTAIALFKDRAMLSVDGNKAKIVRAGDTHRGVKLISSSTSEAVVEVNGARETLELNGTVVLSQSLGAKASAAGLARVEIYVSQGGAFLSPGRINDRSLEFLVDTGASLVVLSSQQANRIGLEYRNGRRTIAATASGNAPMYTVNLPRMSLGEIEVANVEVGIIEGAFPQVPLLGMTFLQKVTMTRSGNVMVLEER